MRLGSSIPGIECLRGFLPFCCADGCRAAAAVAVAAVAVAAAVVAAAAVAAASLPHARRDPDGAIAKPHRVRRRGGAQHAQ